MDRAKHSISIPDHCACSRSVAADPLQSTDGVHAGPARSLTHARTLRAAASMFAFVLPAHAADRFTKLSGAEIAATLSGMQFAEGVGRRDIYRKDGTVRRYEMGRARLGTWRIRGSEICVDFGNDGDTNCFEIWLRATKLSCSATPKTPIRGRESSQSPSTPHRPLRTASREGASSKIRESLD